MIRFDSVTKRYADGTVAASGLRLEAASGEITVLVGPPGSGKTTTLRMINRLTDPTSGRIWLGDRDIASIRPAELRRGRNRSGRRAPRAAPRRARPGRPGRPPSMFSRRTIRGPAAWYFQTPVCKVLPRRGTSFGCLRSPTPAPAPEGFVPWPRLLPRPGRRWSHPPARGCLIDGQV